MIISTTDERVAAAELEHLARSLRPPCQVGEYTLTGHLARSATALLYTARGPAFGNHEGVLKLTGSVYAPILRREVALLVSCADAELDNIVRPLARDLLWLAVGGPAADQPAAALPLPLLSGGDLTVVAARAARTGKLGPELALEAARPIASALRGLLKVIDRPIAHGDVRPQNVLLPNASASLERVQLIDLDAAREIGSGGIDEANALVDDVRGFGELLTLLATGSGASDGCTTTYRAFDVLARRCLGMMGDQYASMADPRLWQDLEAAEAEAGVRGQRGRRSRLPAWLVRWTHLARA